MLPGPDIYYKCPHCRNLLKAGSLLSGNTYGAIRYSDGEVIFPMLPLSPKIAKCKKCDTIFWLHKVEVIEDDTRIRRSFLEDEDWQTTPTKKKRNRKTDRIEPLPKADLQRAIDENIWESQEEELYLRIRLWWKYNELFKTEKIPNYTRAIDLESSNDSYNHIFQDIPKMFTDADDQRRWAQNMQQLTALLNENVLDDKMKMAEIHRNLGNFETCKAILSTIDNEQYTPVKEQMLEMCMKGYMQVFRIQL